jgi:hypothetical protein
MARPKLTVAVHRYYINLTLREGEDDDLIALLTQVPARQRVRLVKRALRAPQREFDNPGGLASSKGLGEEEP